MTEEMDDDRIAQIEASAVDADPDTEAKLARLYELAAVLRVDPVKKREYEMLRNQLMRQLKREGPRWFADANGHKHLAHPVAPEATILDVDMAIEMAARGEISMMVLDLIAPRKQSIEGLRRAITNEHLTSAQVADLVTFESKSAGYVGWLDPESRGE